MRGAADRLFPLALMLALALLTFWLDRALREEQAHPSLRRHDPDFVIGNLRVAHYDAEGRLLSTLAAREMRHYPDDDGTEVAAPVIVQTRPGSPRLTITAERAELSQDGVDVFLHGNVLLVRDPREQSPEQRIRTPFLHVVRDRSLVRTDRDVVISEPDREISARGMEYNNETGQLFLRERVRGRIEPKKKEE